ncbi:MAG TPA: class I SAM-dependent methyltransferase [Flavisolibacter sp.]|nr:class I SAM-dependent methyltransferase [Flavisolibacter sp.]
MITECKVCSNLQGNELFVIKEMQLGLREAFTYQLCGSCGCMQLQDIPHNLSAYYPNKDYYSFTTQLNIRSSPDLLRKIRSSYLIHGKNKIIGSILSAGYKMPGYMEWMKIPQIQFDDSILDVGTGNGSLLLDLYKNGFTNLNGIDPFIDKDAVYNSINILKKDIFQVHGSYDYIMLNHVFEHMDEPWKVLEKLYQLLNPGKYLLIRTPVMGNYGWLKYKENWMPADAPRHIIIHSEKSIRLLAEKAGFKIKQVVYDGDPFTFIASEQYEKDIPLLDKRSYFVNKKDSIFSENEIKKLKQLVKKLNADGQGDQAAFYLYKS